jgi:hypothetical protein
MARRRVLSYRATANLALAGGVASLGSLVTVRLIARGAMDVPALSVVVGVLGVVMWFLGTAAGMLALSTPFKRRATVGLTLCGTVLLAMIALNYLQSQQLS